MKIIKVFIKHVMILEQCLKNQVLSTKLLEDQLFLKNQKKEDWDLHHRSGLKSFEMI